MDLSFYLGELLQQHDEVSVPGLGYFTLARKSGYYADDEHKFYPPYNQVEFDTQFIEDDTLAQYIAQQKNISITSANYFVEKYVTGLKEQALSEKVAIGNLGWFYTENNRLTFQSVDKLADDNHFHGLEPISISKRTIDEPIIEDVKADVHVVTEEPVTIPPVVIEEPVIITPPIKEVPVIIPPVVEEDVVEEIEEEEEEKKSPWRWILILLGILIIVGGTILGLYYYKPDLFEKFILMQNKPAAVNTVKRDTAKAVDTLKAPDTAKTDTGKLIPDTTTLPVKKEVKNKVEKTVNTTPAKAIVPVVKTPAPVIKTPPPVANPAAAVTTSIDDAVGTRRFEVIVAEVKTEKTANKIIDKLKASGVNAWIIPDAPGSNKMISIGHFKTVKEARSYGIQAIENGKVSGEAYPLEIIPKQ